MYYKDNHINADKKADAASKQLEVIRKTIANKKRKPEEATVTHQTKTSL